MRGGRSDPGDSICRMLHLSCVRRCAHGALLLLASFGVAGCAVFAPAPPLPADADAAIRPEAIEAHMRFLADDLLEGREAGTRGYDLAAAYVASQFRLLGLRPAGDEGSYFQTMDLQAHRLVPGSARLVVHPATGGSAPRALRVGDDYLMRSSPGRERSDVRAEAVFVGYGIHAPAFGHDDYDGLDVTGRIAVMLAGAPTSFPSEEGAHYGATKPTHAAERGAVAILMLYTDQFERAFPWPVAQKTIAGRTGLAWVGRDGTPFDQAPTLHAGALVSPDAAAQLFEGAPRTYQQVRAEAATGAPKGFPLAVSLALAQRSIHERRASTNVVGLLEGSDPALRHEHVVMLGHLDHVGIGAPVDGDAIYNGAMDNAAGIAALLETARALASDPAGPRRSVLFLAVTAEEQGLVGADYFAKHPTVPKDSLVAAVNLDMPILLYDFTDVIAFGAQHSTLERVLASTLEEMDLALTPDPMPEQALFTRSDHYAFVLQGVPSVFLTPGIHSVTGEGQGARVTGDFLATHYHRPTDDMRLPIDFEAGARFARVNYRLLKAIANAETRPAWKAGNFFGETFGTILTARR
jgi:Zn-dependent M28 family amino/carboxypeptidase